jgi:hypothetical protein
MSSIADALNSRGTVSWTETIPDLFGAHYKMATSLTDVNADPAACLLRWTSVYTSSDDKLVEVYSVKLQAVSTVDVQPYSRYRASEANLKLEVSPETYVIVMRTDSPLSGSRDLYHKNKLKSQSKLSNDREARVVFSDEQTAHKVADSISRAGKLCETNAERH